MSGGRTCTRCMVGIYVNGVCNHCHKPETKVQDTTVLGVGYVLHGQYYMGDVLGRGGFGITYAAWDMKAQRRVAIKELFPSKDVMRDPDRHTVRVLPGQESYFNQVYRCFEQEAMQLMRLQDQEGVIHIYHAFADNNTIYYAMEYLDGMDLCKYLSDNGPMSWDAFRPKLLTLLQGLERLHREGLIHRDISPDNIFLLNDGSIRLIDFGSVRAYEGNDHFTVFVKQCFAPWEQYLSSGKQGPWTDIYALCVTVYYTLSGKLPPIAPNRRMEDTVVPLNQLCPGLPSNVSNAIMKGMAVKAENRWQSVRELIDQIFPGNAAPAPTGGRMLVCYSGVFQGQCWEMTPGRGLRIGRLPECDLTYPQGTKGISRMQCSIYADKEGRILVRDENSSYGTWLFMHQQQYRLTPGQWYVANGCWLCFGQQEQFLIQ